MAFTANTSPVVPSSYSVGPLKVQHISFTVVSGDTSATITADRLSRLDHLEINGVALTAAPTFSGNTASITFVDPAASRFGTVRCYGR